MDFTVDLSNTGITADEIKEHKDEAASIMEALWSGRMDLSGWVKLPLYFEQRKMRNIVETAEKIKKQCDTLVVIGIGGSYLGAKAVIDAMGGSGHLKADGVEVVFAGTNLSPFYHLELIQKLQGKDICLCVVSKSGSTTETEAVYHIFKRLMIEKYDKAYKERVYFITGRGEGGLRQEAQTEGFTLFTMADDIGGRYSVLSEAGLIPMAAAGVNVKDLHRGAEIIATDMGWDDVLQNYGISRYILKEKGKAVETLLTYEPFMLGFNEWIKQLFAESEGKAGQGILPMSLDMTGDLHSLGQFLQDGAPVFFETIMDIEETPFDITVPSGKYYGKALSELNRAAALGTLNAHKEAGVPLVHISVPEMNAYNMGQLIYYFETTCVITARLMGVDPFDQPGVERYKAEMKKFV
ncbi:MAG: glucose-6-phosphate isomerase [Firmicutes bacterium]|nr:glucose-6-phosphate isomerase [Bacillota bacterium]